MKKATHKAQKTRTTHNLSLAQDYAEIGLPVFPCNDRSTLNSKGKLDGSPLVSWTRLATTDPNTIKAWWQKWPHAVPGIPTGGDSGLAVLDLDRKDGKDGVAAIKAWGFDPDGFPGPVVDMTFPPRLGPG